MKPKIMRLWRAVAGFVRAILLISGKEVSTAPCP